MKTFKFLIQFPPLFFFCLLGLLFFFNGLAWPFAEPLALAASMRVRFELAGASAASPSRWLTFRTLPATDGPCRWRASAESLETCLSSIFSAFEA